MKDKTKRGRLKLPWRRKTKVQRDVKDRLFRFLFERDKKALLQLYNALNGTSYTDESKLQVVTIENAVYVVMKNDLAFILAGTLNLYEHQSTYSPNLPVRFLIYLAEEYQKLIGQTETSLYGSTLIPLPAPKCVVFYNGEKNEPEETELRLSDAYISRDKPADVELRVRMVNINYGHNGALMGQCRTLEEYAHFVEISRRNVAAGMEMQEALSEAIDYCIEHGILYETLKEHRTEVLGMLLEEFDADKYEKTLRLEGREEGFREGIEEGRKAGREEGRKAGREEGREEGREQGLEQGAQALIETSIEFNSTREETVCRLMEKLKISRAGAEAYMARFWR